MVVVVVVDVLVLVVVVVDVLVVVVLVVVVVVVGAAVVVVVVDVVVVVGAAVVVVVVDVVVVVGAAVVVVVVVVVKGVQTSSVPYTFVSSEVYKKVSPLIVSVQKKPNPRPFNACRKEVRLGSKVMEYVKEFMTILAYPQDKFAEVISHEYFVVAFTEYSFD